MAALVATSMGVVREVLGDSVVDEVDQPIVDYIANVLADQDFDFGPPDGHGIFDALGELLIDARCVYDQEHCLEVCAKLCEKLGSHGIVKPKPAVRSLAAPLRMNAGMEEEKAPKQKEYIFDAPPLSARDKAKIERNKRKEDRQREAQYEMHVAEMEALRAGMPPVYVNHSNVGGSTIRDIHMENFSVTVGGRDLIQDQTLTLAFGRHYGLIGRNGTGKTSLLRAMAQHAIDGIPKNCQILHVEQEVTGDDTTALQCVLNADVERVQLMQEEARLGQQLKDLEYEAESSQSLDKNKDSLEKDAIGKRLEEIYKRLEYIDADAAEARAASILAGLSFTPEMQLKNTKAFSGGWRMRIALARALFIEPDLLLLDEPTNHLDLHAVLWLETYLLKWPKTFIVVSHAREFLNTVVTDILHLHGKKLHAYKGDYDTFERTREEHLKNQMKAFETNEKARGHMQAGQLHLVKPYMAAVESNNVSAVNETLNELYVEEEDYERLHESADMHDNFNLITLARKVNLFNFMDIKILRSILKKFGKDAGTTKEELARRAEKEYDSMLNQLSRAALWNLCKGNNVCYKVTETREALASKLINHKKKMMIKLEAERELQGKVSNELEADASSTHAEVSFSRDRTNDLSFECEPVPLDGLDDAEAGASGGHAYYVSPMLQSQADRKTAILEQILGQLAENQRQYVSDRQQILEQLSELHCQRENDRQQIQRQLAELQQQNEQIQGQLAELQQQSESDRQENRDLRNLALVSLAATARHSSQFSAAMALLDESLTAICRL